MSQPSFLASGTTPLRSDTKSRVWAKILGTQQNRSGAAAVNDPKRTDTLWRTKFKLARAMAANGCPIGSGSGGGGGGGGGGTGDPDVDAFLICSGIAQTDTIIVTALLDLVTSLKNNSLWTGMDAIYPFVGGSPTAHSCNLRDITKYSITWHGSVTHNSNGITGDGSTGYGDTGFGPSTALGNFQRNTGSIGCYPKGALTNTNHMLACTDNVTNQTSLAYQTGPSIFTAGVNCDTLHAPGAAPTTINGFCAVAREDATNCTNYYNGNVAAYTQASKALISFPFYLLAINAAGTAANFVSINMAFAFISGAWTSTQMAALSNIVLTFQNALGRA